ncbi:MAG: MarR family transcriptional regulator [Gemmatimonadaceae bacterium]|nr:MarR family transcriptional regulator [Gemmatimonadaceae bacterium]
MSRRQRTIVLGLPSPLTPDARRVLLFRLLLANAHELRTRMDRLLAESGLTTQQAMLLQVLQGEPEPPTLTGFAARLSMSHQNLKQIATALARKGFIEIVADRSDARVRRLRLTARHTQLWQQRNSGDHAEVMSWTSALPDREVSAVVKTLDALLGSLRSES